MDLKGRLKLVADMTPESYLICDIGTDHAYIPIYLLEKGKCKKAIAADVKIGPVMAAKTNVSNAGLEQYIETRLGDGLFPIHENEADVIIIAGMGGQLITQILSQGFSKAKAAKRLILQPMNGIELVREWLYTNGFDISDENLVAEGEKIYDVIAASWTGELNKVEEIHLLIGQKLIEKRDPLLERLLRRRIKQLDKVINEIKNASCVDEKVLNERSNTKCLLQEVIEQVRK